MKRTLLICLTGIFSVAGFSQNIQKEYSLAEVRSSDDLEYEIYSYNDNQLLKATHILMDNGTMVKDSLRYDASNNITKIDGYQLINGSWTHVSYIEYTYDANGNRLSRSNYNSFGGTTFTLGGIYNYEYENDRLVRWNLLMGGTTLFEKATLTYNTEGKVVEELAQDNWNSGSWENSWKIVYDYNPDSTLKSSHQFFWNGFSWDTPGGDWFYYDDNQNCIKWEYKSGTRVTNKNEYEYNLDYTVEQLVLPLNPEVKSEKKSMVEMNNMVTLQHWYTEDDQGNLSYICDYIYTYDYIGTASISNLSFEVDNFSVYPNPSTDFVTIFNRTNNIRTIDVIDASGKSALKVTKVNKKEMNLDISGLSTGIYYLRMSTSKGIITQKLVKE
ncbi:T9SS type A sorting domain-containing protein [Aequorivita sp. H23M31]|uniref:T9SS type A sorting domain-containing protein n=1 Tax=Aequorivita ciconiae TaxID=2494375 RepID=A0A410G457_9FLAO|nr:T9SS type A sorting domain-containing protein [Aequorivita sp. H23M31]QAA82057.1 T9SS type A sorting domain-containing protein [Aequorivita sp. H23M31]